MATVNILMWVSHLSTAAVFLLAATQKARHAASRRTFTESLAGVGFGRRWRGPLLWAVVLAELAAGVLNVVPTTAQAGSSLAAVLLVAFVGVTVREILRGGSTRCACFGGATMKLGPVHVVRNGLLLVLVLPGLAMPPQPISAMSPASWLVVGLSTPIATLLFVRFEWVSRMVGPDSSATNPRGVGK
jgi:uncharacterized membrane protein YphA (DoxX/SURF4 family)